MTDSYLSGTTEREDSVVAIVAAQKLLKILHRQEIINEKSFYPGPQLN
jgi:hypothetical protein